MAISLYRKYRPNTFADVVGQEHVINTLANAVASGDVAHAYLFCGPRGTGKTTSARLLAKALLCESGPTAQPDGSCPQCLEIAEGTHPDVYELDAASRTGVENVREEIISRVQFAPTRGRSKVYIIDEVHMLSPAAFNALLKTLEEPPAHVVFVMCTTDPHKVPETIQSRCQRFDFRRFTVDEICSYLQRICAGEGFSAQPEALEFIAAKAAGGMRDATTALEQVAVAGAGTITLASAQAQLGQTESSALFELGGYIAARDTANAFLWLNRQVIAGVDLNQTARDLSAHLRDLLAAALTGGINGIVACPVQELPRYQQQAAAFGGQERLSRALTTAGALVQELRNSTNPRLSFEIALVRLCRAESELTLEALAERVESLEAGLPAPQLSGELLSAMASQAVASALAAAGTLPVAAAPEPAPQAQEPEQPVADHRPVDVGPTGVPHPDIPAFEEEDEEEWVPEEDDSQLPWDDDPSVALPWDAEPRPLGEDVPFGGSCPADSAAAPAAGSASEPAPQAEPAVQPAVAPDGSAMSPARLMAAIHAAVKREDESTDALLTGVSVEQDAGGYHLVFPESGGFAMRLASQGSTRQLIENAFASALGHPVAFDCVAGSCKVVNPDAPAPAAVFGSVSAAEAAAPAPSYDEGYLEAQAAYADSYEEPPYAYDGYVPEPAYAPEPAFDPAAYAAEREQEAASGAASIPAAEELREMAEPAPLDDATASSIADALSVFGGGIKFEEV
ncbi:MAG: DNA polymerase III subunit gamma/tau [Coriobacteriales bacterium]